MSTKYYSYSRFNNCWTESQTVSAVLVYTCINYHYIYIYILSTRIYYVINITICNKWSAHNPSLLYKKHLKISKRYSEAVSRRRTDNKMAKRKSTKEQTLQRKITME